MLYFNGKPWKKSLEALLESKQIVNTCPDEISRIKKILGKGDNVYTTICPFTTEIYDRNELQWDTDHDRLEQRMVDIAQEI